MEGQIIATILDTGARPSVIDTHTLDSLGLRERLVPKESTVYGLCETPVLVQGFVNVSVEVPGEVPIQSRIFVIRDCEPTMLMGRQFLRQFGKVSFNWDEGTIEIGKAKLPILSTATGGDPVLRAQTVLGLKGDETDLSAYPHLTASELEALSLLLEEFSDVFSERPGKTKMCEHPIETGTSTPVRVRPRRLPPRWEEEINTQLYDMLTQNICRPSISTWASDVVLVTKKDGRQRFAIDYRRLNDITKKDAYSIPNIQAILDRLHGSRYYSVIDISAAYWCVPLRKGDIEKTAFN